MATPGSEITRLIEEDHQRLHAHLDALQSVLDQEGTPEPFSKWKLEFLWQVRDVQHQLLKHFDLEEEGGFMTDLLRQAPQHAHEIERLEAQHQEVFDGFLGILEDLKAVEQADDPALDDVRTRLRTMLSLLHGHEAAERALVQDVYFQDYGLGD